ncbi:MAG: hypothetical protein AB1782_20870 [Cyanobacteriota bacterium]
MSLKRDSKGTKSITQKASLISGRKNSANDDVLFLLKALNTTDHQLCVDIENDLVKIGKKAINQLIEALENTNNKVRSHAAMALIRIGSDSIEPLVSVYKNKSSERWMADFIISEIVCSKELLVTNSYYESMAS